MITFLIIGIIALCVFFPGDAYAWGPGMHVETALRLLANPALIAPGIAALISAFPEDFVYGSTSPDIVVGKKYAGYHHHCHNWRMGHLILAEAADDEQRAAAYGYLAHLAMDVVAHNYFIPFKIIRSFETKLLSHVYWEMRFDLGVADEAWDFLDKISAHEVEAFDDLLERVLRKTLFSFSTNKRIFNTILILQRMKGTRESLKLYAASSRWELAEMNRQHYVDLTWESVTNFLADPDSARCIVADPAGRKRLAYANNLRRRMKAMLDRQLMTPEQAMTLVAMCRQRLFEGLYEPKLQLPDVIDVI